MGSTEEAAAYAAFEEKVKRTVYIDNLSPQVTEGVIISALDPFGNVQNVQFIPNYLEPKNMPRAALVEMENVKQAMQIISVMSTFPFMILGMPRPARAQAAQMGMFDERPRKPGRQLTFKWLDPEDPDFAVAKKLKNMVRKHDSETELLLKSQLEKEEKLAAEQAESLKTNYKKYQLIDGAWIDGSANRLARGYNINDFASGGGSSSKQ